MRGYRSATLSGAYHLKYLETKEKTTYVSLIEKVKLKKGDLGVSRTFIKEDDLHFNWTSITFLKRIFKWY